MAEHDYIQLQDDERGHVLLRAGVRFWPPPEDVWLVYPVADGEPGRGSTAVCAADGLADLVEIYARHDVEAVVTPFRQVSRSQLPNDFDFTHVARGALYVVA